MGQQKHRIKELFVFEGLQRVKVTSVMYKTYAITGIEGFEIGDSMVRCRKIQKHFQPFNG